MRAAFVAFVGASFFACNAILGLSPQHLREDAGAVDDGAALDGSQGDASGHEAGASAYAREVLADQPLLYFRFGESGGATAHDEMGAFDAAYPTFGVTYRLPGAIANDPNTAVALDGQSKIQVPRGADFAPKAPFSVEVWLQVASPPAALGFVIDHEDFSGPRRGWDIVIDDTGLSFERWGAAGNSAVPAPALKPATWTHLLFTWDGSVARSFVNGQLGTENNSLIAIDAVAGGFSVGGQNCTCSGTFYKGALDELAIYDKVLLGDRVQAHLRAAGR
jgi:hypothetical protein